MRFFVAVLLLSVVSHVLRAQQPNDSDANTKQMLEAAAPVDVAPEPTEPLERALRATRNRLQNSPVLARFDTRPSEPASVIFVDTPPNVRPVDFQFPVRESDTILLASVTKVQPYLSEDGTRLYTEFTVSVEDVLKDSAGLFLKRNSAVVFFRIGGALRLASGRVVRTDVHGLGDPPVAGRRYVSFLNYDPRGYWFRIVRLWEMRNSVAVPLDPIDQGLARAGRSQFTGMDESAFLSAVRDAVERAGAQR